MKLECAQATWGTTTTKWKAGIRTVMATFLLWTMRKWNSSWRTSTSGQGHWRSSVKDLIATIIVNKQIVCRFTILAYIKALTIAVHAQTWIRVTLNEIRNARMGGYFILLAMTDCRIIRRVQILTVFQSLVNSKKAWCIGVASSAKRNIFGMIEAAHRPSPHH